MTNPLNIIPLTLCISYMEPHLHNEPYCVNTKLITHSAPVTQKCHLGFYCVENSNIVVTFHNTHT